MPLPVLLLETRRLTGNLRSFLFHEDISSRNARSLFRYHANTPVAKSSMRIVVELLLIDCFYVRSFGVKLTVKSVKMKVG
jgi:hypothetical protein